MCIYVINTEATNKGRKSPCITDCAFVEIQQYSTFRTHLGHTDRLVADILIVVQII